VAGRWAAVSRALAVARGMLGAVTDADTRVGTLLIADPLPGDPNFERTVVLMIEHRTEGALGVVLNRPSDLEVGAVLEEWADLAAAPSVLYVGGPVEPNGVLALGRSSGDAVAPGWTPVVGDVGTIDLHLQPDEVAPRVAGIRFFVGYSGWGGGQLESELAEGAWLVVDAIADDVFAPDPETMWRSVLRRQGGKVSMLADFPVHPSLN
jgi:putative transcriptional regulator